ncbi:BatD family protein [Litorilituus lipolyticus]|nr:BatD family protein [Litorilituus lipolyticus]
MIKSHMKFFSFMKVSLIKFLAVFILSIINMKLAFASNIAQLILENQLLISAQIRNENTPIVGQPVVISIEIATNRWFSSGTRVKPFKLSNTVILAHSELAINGSRRINGETWSTQTREITLYPTKQGDYQLPPIEVFVSVNTEQYGIVEGTSTTEALHFSTVLPEALAEIQHYIVSPKVTVEIDGTLNNEEPYSLGEAISQTITITAENTPAMMIPPLELPTIEGVSIYQTPTRIFDKSNRGSLLGTRIESNTYIFEFSGTYQIAEQTVFWWNTQTQQLEQITIPAQQWQVSGQGLTAKVNKAWLNHFNNKLFLIVLITLSVLLCLVFLLKRYRTWLIMFYKTQTKQEQRKLASAFIRAINKQQYPTACQILYRYHWHINKQNVIPSNPLLSQLNQQTFKKTTSKEQQFTEVQAKKLLKYIRSLAKIKQVSTPNKHINLNN